MFIFIIKELIIIFILYIIIIRPHNIADIKHNAVDLRLIAGCIVGIII